MVTRLVAFVLFLGGVMFSAGSAMAATANSAPEPVGSDVSAAVTCYVAPKAGVSSVNVRRTASATAERIGIMYPGQRAVASCSATSGGSYTACGGSSTWWVRVTWNGATGYVAQRCVDWYY